ncbi:hypothetical protein ABPG72_002694 [Tetrahymena utriculariae]
MSQSVAHSRQQSKNQIQLQKLKKEKSKGDLDSRDLCHSPQNKCYSLIKRFHKKQPENFENSHLKYLQNGIKDISKRNINFQIKANESNQIQHQDRINLHKRFTDPYLKEEFIEQHLSNNSKNRLKDQCANSNQTQYQQNKNQSYPKQGSMKPIRTICLNLYETQEQQDQSLQLTDRRDKQQQENTLQSSNLDLSQLNKSVKNQQNICNQQINIGKVQFITNTLTTQLSNSTRFSPRQGINFVSQNSQQSIKQNSKDQYENFVACGNLFGFPESSESDLNQNDSTITTPTKYQQFYEGQYNLGINLPQYSKLQQKNQPNVLSNSSFNKNNQQISTTPKIQKKNNQQMQDKSTNQNFQKEKCHLINNSEHSINANTSLNSSKVNLCFFLKGTGGKQVCSPNQSSLINSNLNSRKSSNQINSCDSNQIFWGDPIIHDTVKESKCKSQIKNSRGNSISKNKSNVIYTNDLQSSPKQQSNLMQNQQQQQNVIPLIKKLNKSNQHSQNTSFTQLQNKIKSFEVQSDDFITSKNSQQTQINQNAQKNLNSSKILSITNQQQTNLTNVNYTQINLITPATSLIQSCNMNAQRITHFPYLEQINQYLKNDVRERDRSQTQTLDNQIRQRSMSKGQINIQNSQSQAQNSQQFLNKSQIKLNQSSSQINLSTANGTASQSIIPSQNSAFNFQPSFFTPIDNDSLQGFILKQTARNNSQVIDQNQQKSQLFTKQKSCTQFELQTITSFVQLEEEIEKNAKQQKILEQQKKTKYLC